MIPEKNNGHGFLNQSFFLILNPAAHKRIWLLAYLQKHALSSTQTLLLVLFPFHSTVDTCSTATFRFLDENHHFMVPLSEKANQHSRCDTAKKKGR